MKKLISILSLLVLYTNQKAQPLYTQSFTIGGPDAGYSQAITIDKSGNTYTTGRFYMNMDFDPGPNVYNLTASPIWDLFVCKHDSNGNFVWAGSTGGVFDDRPKTITIDDSGFVYVTGIFMATADFDFGPDTFNVIVPMTMNTYGNFILKLKPDGTLVWVKNIIVHSNPSGINALAVDASGNIYLTGKFSGTVDFDPGPSVFNLSCTVSTDLFFMKLNANGDFIWAASSGSNGEGTDVAIDKYGSIYFTGYITSYYQGNAADLDPGTGIDSVSTPYVIWNMYDAYVVKLNNSDSLAWVKRFQGQGNEIINFAKVDEQGNLYLCGQFSYTTDLDPGPGIYNLSANGQSLYTSNMDVFILKLDASGDFQFAKRFGGTNDESVKAFELDNKGSMTLLGFFKKEVDFDPGPNEFKLTAEWTGDDFVLQLDSAGSFLCAGGFLLENNNNTVTSMALTKEGNICLTGSFYQPFDLDMSSGTNVLTLNGGNNIFVSKYNFCESQLSFIAEKESSDFSIYPNPSNSQFTLQPNENLKSKINYGAMIFVFDQLGNCVLRQQCSNSPTQQINISNLAKGIYFVEVEFEEGRINKKIVAY